MVRAPQFAPVVVASLMLLLVVAPAIASAEEPRAPTKPPTSALKPGTHIEFHGWSPDSRSIAYTRLTRTQRRPGARIRTKVSPRLRRVQAGKLVGSASIKRRLAVWAKKRRYVVEEPVAESISEDGRVRDYRFPEGPYRFEIVVADVVEWRLSFRGEVFHRQPFSELYVDATVALRPSPDRAALLVVLHLDTGWTTHGAVYTLPLPELAQRHRVLQERRSKDAGREGAAATP